jgi:hypothetical protein
MMVIFNFDVVFTFKFQKKYSALVCAQMVAQLRERSSKSRENIPLRSETDFCRLFL